MQMGDCNASSTFQQLMTAVFQDYIGWFIHVYMNNIFIFSPLWNMRGISDSYSNNWDHHHLYLSFTKVDLYVKKM